MMFLMIVTMCIYIYIYIQMVIMVDICIYIFINIYKNHTDHIIMKLIITVIIIEGSLEVKLPTIWTVEKQR